MRQAGMTPPTFESDRASNTSVLRLLLHHFLDDADLKWLAKFEPYSLNENEKRGVIFTREVGAIDNLAYRQINGCDGARASRELRQLRDLGLLEQKNSGRTTYYKPGPSMSLELSEPGKVQMDLFVTRGTEEKDDQANGSVMSSPIEPATALIEPGLDLIEPGLDLIEPARQSLLNHLPIDLQQQVQAIGLRSNEPGKVTEVILQLCSIRPYSLEDLSILLRRKSKYLLFSFITPLRQQGHLQFTIPEMPNHPNQAYTTSKQTTA